MTPCLAFGMPGAPEWVFLGILALILFGPKKIPEIARGLGKAMGELQKAKEEFHREISGLPPLPKIETPEGRQSSGVTPSLSASVSDKPTDAPAGEKQA